MSKGNEPAYPWGEYGTVLGGLTKREYFAGLAMQGMLAGSAQWVADDPKFLAKTAIAIADCLLSELEKSA